MGDYTGQTYVSSNTPSESYKQDTRNFKGYCFEIEVCKKEFDVIPNIEYNCNPSDYSDWLQNHNKNSFDAQVTYPNGKTEKIEMKFISDGVKIESSWFRRDWLPRDCDIYVTSNPTAIKYKDRREAEKSGKKIMSVSEYKSYASKKAYNILHPNQLSSWNSLIHRLVIVILVKIEENLSKLTSFWFKSRLKKDLFNLKTALIARLSKSHNAVTQANSIQHLLLEISQSLKFTLKNPVRYSGLGCSLKKKETTSLKET